MSLNRVSFGITSVPPKNRRDELSPTENVFPQSEASGDGVARREMTRGIRKTHLASCTVRNKFATREKPSSGGATAVS